MSDSLGGRAVDREYPVTLLYPAVPVRQAPNNHLVDLQPSEMLKLSSHNSLHPAHRDLLALVVGTPGEGDADGAPAELPVEDDDHDLVRGCAALLQGLVCFIYQILELL